MPRTAREKSETGIYHVMIRGMDQGQLFFEDGDRAAFLDILARYKKSCGFELYAYCLMGNHVHLLLKEKSVELAEIMKRMALSYSSYFNTKYDRSGYLFQGRYKSEAISDDEYLLEVLRYIHCNPVKIGGSVSDWTSHDEYANDSRLIDVDFVLTMFHADRGKARKLFQEFISAPPNDEKEMLGEERKSLRDTDAVRLIKKIGKVDVCNELSEFEKRERNRVLSELMSEGLSVRQISRLTGISRGIVHRAKGS